MIAFKNVILLLVVLCATSAIAQSYEPYEPYAPEPYEELSVRREWRTLSPKERRRYIRAVKCMMRKPSRFGRKSEYPGALTQYDDLTLVHIIQTENVHFTGQFLPWHRWHVYLYEIELRSTCRYEGPLPYWDITRDISPEGEFLDSPIFDRRLGFGGNGESVPVPDDFVIVGLDNSTLTLGNGTLPFGNGTLPLGNSTLPPDVSENFTGVRGNALIAAQAPSVIPLRTGGGCIVDGPFKNHKITLGPNFRVDANRRCLNRDFAPAILNGPILELLAQLEDAPSFEAAGALIELPHGAGHGSIGGFIGEMSNLFSSPNDPLFYLHHANVDRIWWNWQAGNLSARLDDISGFARTTGNELVSLDFEMTFEPWAAPRTIGSVMDIRELGYRYDDD